VQHRVSNLFVTSVVTMGHSYSLPTVKILFGQASKCAYPGCDSPLIFEDKKRNVRSVSVQIAHIRSGSRNGPRFESGFAAVNEPKNLLLLCGTHHKPVDDLESVYTIQELESWKAEQIKAGGAGVELLEAETGELSDKLDQLLDRLSSATELRLNCEVRVGVPSQGGLLSLKPEAVDVIGIGWDKQHVGEPSYVGMTVQNTGSLECEVVAVGFELDLGANEYNPTWQIHPSNFLVTQAALPYRLRPHAEAMWFHEAQSLKTVQANLMRQYKLMLVSRIRAYCVVGSGTKVHSDWLSALLIPGLLRGTQFTQQELDRAAESRDARRTRP
jgi:hypothetical protein